jgi:uncharacterized protein YjbI with pentapeptide repeats
MADQECLTVIKAGGGAEWNEWSKTNVRFVVDLSEADLSYRDLAGIRLKNVKLNGAILTGTNLSNAFLQGADLRRADLREANLTDADLTESDLTDSMLEKAFLQRANLNGANLTSVRLKGATLISAKLRGANLSRADLSNARIWKAHLRRANLSNAEFMDANLGGSDLREANLREANLAGAKLHHTRFESATLIEANLGGADLREARLNYADMRKTNLTKAVLFKADLSVANLSNAILTGADLRASSMLSSTLKNAIMDDVMLWASQRAGWNVKRVGCSRAFWDKNGQEPTLYQPGEFEKLYSDQACIELFYQGGVSKFELNTLPALLHHLASLHQDANIRLKSIEETGGGAKISISVGDADTETVGKIKSDALQVYQAQLALRDNEILRLDTEKKYLESFVSERLIKAMLTATTPQNVFNAPVYGAAFPSGRATVELHQNINDNTAILALLESIMRRHEDMDLSQRDANLLDAEVQSAKAELEKPAPNPSILLRSLSFVQKIAGEAVAKAAGKLGEQAASADWSSLLHQLNQFVAHLP